MTKENWFLDFLLENDMLIHVVSVKRWSFYIDFPNFQKNGIVLLCGKLLRFLMKMQKYNFW